MEMNDRTPFEQALMDVMLEEFADVPEEEQIQCAASESFYKNCGKLIRRSSRHPVSRARVALKRGILIAAIVVALATTAMAFPDVKDAVIRLFVRDYGNRYAFCFDPEEAATAPKTIETVYQVTWIPEGYALVSVDSSMSGVSSYWYNETNDGYIMFDQSVIGGIEFAPNAGGSEAEERNVSGYQVFCIRDDATKYYWTDNAYFYSLYCGKGISEAQMQRIFDSVRAETAGE